MVSWVSRKLEWVESVKRAIALKCSTRWNGRVAIWTDVPGDIHAMQHVAERVGLNHYIRNQHTPSKDIPQHFAQTYASCKSTLELTTVIEALTSMHIVEVESNQEMIFLIDLKQQINPNWLFSVRIIVVVYQTCQIRIDHARDRVHQDLRQLTIVVSQTILHNILE